MIAAVMPCRGRAEQTIRNVKRLLATAGRVEWQLICMVDNDPVLNKVIREEALPIWYASTYEQRGYWECLKVATDNWPEFSHLVNLANDLLPGRDWLARCYAAYRARFGDGDGLMGFNDGIHGPDLSPHFLISRNLLDRYGGWPVWYKHNYGDAELCERAQADGCYGKAPWAVLYHDHPINGAAHDSVYSEGSASQDADGTLFFNRRRQAWPRVSVS